MTYLVWFDYENEDAETITADSAHTALDIAARKYGYADHRGLVSDIGDCLNVARVIDICDQ